jgi:L-lactate dehydrogenase complex protein LldG
VVGPDPGTVVVSEREEMLARIRSARADAQLVEPARDYRARGEHDAGSDALLDLLEDRLLDYKATVRRTDDAGLRDTVAAALTATGADSPVLLPPDLPMSWAPEGRADDGALTPTELDGFVAVVTACRVACAETGTIVLDGAPDQGRRAITLVPDVHVCVVRADQVVQTVPEMVARLDPARPTTFVSGPSATSDIELDRVEGVHGPRTLSVVLVTSDTRRKRPPVVSASVVTGGRAPGV